MQAYADHFIHIDHWIEYFCKNNKTSINCTHHLLSNKEHEATELYQDFSRPQDIYYGIGGMINMNTDTACYLTFQRSKNQHGFEQHYLDALKTMIPHLRRSIAINKRLEHAEFRNNLLSDTLNQINSPLCLVDKRGAIVYINELAERLLEDCDCTSIKNNHLVIREQEKHNALQTLIQQATNSNEKDQLTHGGAMYCKNTLSDGFLSILVNPINPDRASIESAKDEIALILFNTNKHRITLTTNQLSGLYNLTPAEASLSLQLCYGLTLDEICTTLNKRRNTIKSQLRSCFNKLGISRQSELINLINTDPAGIVRKQ